MMLADRKINELEGRIAKLEAELAETVEHLRYQNNAADFLNREGYRRCDISACNCGSWHGGELVSSLVDARKRAEQADAERDRLRDVCRATKNDLSNWGWSNEDDRDLIRCCVKELGEALDD